jgi:hypothetical protein
MNWQDNELILAHGIYPLIVMKVDEVIFTINLFRKNSEATVKIKKRKERQDERRQKARDRGEKPIK